jgi:hypothetical protein
MSYSKKYFPVFIICILLSSCCIFNSKQLVFDKIAFGKGGGFTGRYDEYLLNNKGELYKKDASTGSFILLKKLSKKETKNIFKEVEANKLFEIKFRHPYNITCYLEIEKDTASNRIVWGDAKNPPPSPVTIMFNKLMDLTKTNINSEGNKNK